MNMQGQDGIVESCGMLEDGWCLMAKWRLEGVAGNAGCCKKAQDGAMAAGRASCTQVMHEFCKERLHRHGFEHSAADEVTFCLCVTAIDLFHSMS